MTCFSHSLIGLIEIEPRPTDVHDASRSGDTVTLDGWLKNAAVGTAYPTLCASGRWNRSAPEGSISNIRADLTQLVEDLQAEYDRILGR